MTSIICNQCRDEILPSEDQLYLPTRTLCALCANFATRDEVLQAEKERKAKSWKHDQETRAKNSCTECGHLGIVITAKGWQGKDRKLCGNCGRQEFPSLA